MKYFTKEVKIALTAIAAVALVFCGINFLKGRNLFKSSNLYYVRFNDIAGLTVSNSVYADGFAVGIVREINYDYDRLGKVVVGIELDKAMRIPCGTIAELESEMLGGVKMNLLLAPNPLNSIEVGDTINGQLHNGAVEKMSAMVPAIEKMLPKLDSILTSVNKLLTDPALAQTLHNTNDITANLKQSTSQLNTLLGKDVPKLMGRLDRVGANVEIMTSKMAKIDVEGTMTSVQNTLGNVEQFTTMLNKKFSSRDNTMGLLLNDPSIYNHLNKTLAHSDSLMIDIKAHPKRYVHFSVFGKKEK
ncbi:MAG: MlaD family protein [Bacteroidaceae bacterium]